MAHQQDLLNASAGIPLHCNVCPRKPDFSDVSHLLTHIASKGHLSNYYKLKIKAASDRGAQRVTDEYDRWYEEYNVQDLMGERMKQKEKRKVSNSGSSVGQSRRASGVHITARNTPSLPTYADRRRQGLRESTLDPQLGPRIKIEPDSRPGTPLSALSVDPATLSRNFVPPMLQSWSMTPYENSPMTQDASMFDDSLESSPSSEWVGSEAPRRGRRRTARNLSASNRCSVYDDEEEEDELEYDDGQADNTKLKGVYWDGMGIFDSATPDMRRKRNQKKAYSVVRSLMATSEVVEPTEMVFGSDGELQREREITGNPNEDDDGMGLLKGEESPEVSSPPPRKKTVTRRPRPALVRKNVNNGRVLRRRDSRHPASNKGFGRGPYYDGPDDDDELTYGPPRPKKRSGLSIHRDNSGPEITFDNPASMSTLTSSFQPRSHGSGRDSSMFQNSRSAFHNSYTHQRLPSFSNGGNSAFRSAHTPQLGSFGQFGQSIFPNHHFGQNPYAMMNSVSSLAAFQQHIGGLGMGQPGNSIFGHDGMFHAQPQNLVQPQNA